MTPAYVQRSVSYAML